MTDVLFVKYNQSRAPKYATKTVVFEDRGKRGVYKEALGEEAKAHIESFDEKYELTKDLFLNISCLKCKLENGRVYYDFIKGHTLDDELSATVGDAGLFVNKIQELLDKYYAFNQEKVCQFVATAAYTELFGEIDLTGMECVRPVNLDMIFDNVMLVDGKAIAYDYEWVYDMALPQGYIVYRVLSRAYDKYAKVVSNYWSFEDFVLKFGISSQEIEVYAKLEQTLINNIYGAASEYNDFVKYIRKERSEFASDDVKAQKIEDLEEQILQLNQQANNLQNEINNMIYSRSWKSTKWLRTLTNFARKVKRHGMGFVLSSDPYNIAPNENELKKQREERFAYEPLISVITPLFNTDKRFLVELIKSVQAQTYSNWELCFVDFSDEENHARVEKIVNKFAKKDRRVRYERDANNRGIAENTNRVIAMAAGEYLALLDHDDVLHPYAFNRVVHAINEKWADFIYTDEVKFTKKVSRTLAPYYKPDFSADQLRVQNYICHLNVYKKSLLVDYGIHYDDNFNGSQDHDIVLRLTEKASHIVHIPEVLYYWRVHAASVASNISAKPYCTTSGINAINAQYKRMGEDLKVKSSYMNIPRYKVVAPKSFKEDIHVIVWNAKNEAQVDLTVRSIQKDMGKTFEVTTIPEDETEITSAEVTRILSSVKTSYALFVRAGVEVESKRTVSELLTYVRRADCAAAEAKLVTKDNKIFNGGLHVSKSMSPAVQIYGFGKSKDEPGYEAMLHHGRSVSAVSGLFTLVKVKDYLDIAEGETTGANPFVATSLHAGEAAKTMFFTPYVYCKTEAFDQKIQGNYEDDALDCDPFFNENILRYNLD